MGWSSSENLGQLMCDLVALVYLLVSLIGISVIIEIFFLTFNFPLFHPCPSEIVNIGSSDSYPIFLLAMEAGLVVLSVSGCVDCLL